MPHCVHKSYGKQADSVSAKVMFLFQSGITAEEIFGCLCKNNSEYVK